MALDTIFYEFFIQKTHFYEYNSFFLYFSLNALGSKIGEFVNTLNDKIKTIMEPTVFMNSVYEEELVTEHKCYLEYTISNLISKKFHNLALF
jgi:hypothetical protein